MSKLIISYAGIFSKIELSNIQLYFQSNENLIFKDWFQHPTNLFNSSMLKTPSPFLSIFTKSFSIVISIGRSEFLIVSFKKNNFKKQSHLMYIYKLQKRICKEKSHPGYIRYIPVQMWCGLWICKEKLLLSNNKIY